MKDKHFVPLSAAEFRELVSNVVSYDVFSWNYDYHPQNNTPNINHCNMPLRIAKEFLLSHGAVYDPRITIDIRNRKYPIRC